MKRRSQLHIGHIIKMNNKRICNWLQQFSVKGTKGKAEHLYSVLHGIQTTLKCSGWITQFNLQGTPCPPLPRKRSPDGATTDWGSEHLIAAHYSFINPERTKGGWLTSSRRFTHISCHPSAEGWACDRESLPVKTNVLATVPHHRCFSDWLATAKIVRN